LFHWRLLGQNRLDLRCLFFPSSVVFSFFGSRRKPLSPLYWPAILISSFFVVEIFRVTEGPFPWLFQFFSIPPWRPPPRKSPLFFGSPLPNICFIGDCLLLTVRSSTRNSCPSQSKAACTDRECDSKARFTQYFPFSLFLGLSKVVDSSSGILVPNLHALNPVGRPLPALKCPLLD